MLKELRIKRIRKKLKRKTFEANIIAMETCEKAQMDQRDLNEEIESLERKLKKLMHQEN